MVFDILFYHVNLFSQFRALSGDNLARCKALVIVIIQDLLVLALILSSQYFGAMHHILVHYLIDNALTVFIDLRDGARRLIKVSLVNGRQS